MPVAISRQYVVSAHQQTLEISDPLRNIRTIHGLPPDVTIVKVDCYCQGGVALTSKGQVLLFRHGSREFYACDEAIADISCGESELLMTTVSGRFIKIGFKLPYLVRSPPPVRISVGAAKVAHISQGRLFLADKHIPHPQPVIQVAVGGGHTVFLDAQGNIYGFWQQPQRPARTRDHRALQHTGAVALLRRPAQGSSRPRAHRSARRGRRRVDDRPPAREEVPTFGFQELRRGVVDVDARTHVTVLELADGDIDVVGEMS